MFQFSLQPLLKHRKHLEEARQKAFSDQKKKYLLEEKRLAHLRQTRDQCAEEFSEKQTVGVTVSESLLYTSYFRRLSDEIKIREIAVTRAATKMEKKRLELVDAVKNRKTIEKLKEKKHREYLEASQKKEEKFMNEVAVTRFGRTG